MLKTTVESNSERWLAGLFGADFLLWTPRAMEQGFLNWERIFATRKIDAGQPIPLPRADTELEVQYDFMGKRRDVNDLMRDEHLAGLIILKDGEVLLERYALGLDPEKTWQASSMTKSLTSILFGAAVHDGHIRNLDGLVTSYLPELIGTNYEGVTVRNLLQMTAGLVFNENYEDVHADVGVKYIRHIAERRSGAILEELKSIERAHAQGEQFAYNTGDTFLLSHILSRAVGMSVAEYCSQRVWKPMGMEVDGFFLLDSDDGQEVTGSCSGASLRDFARLGLLMLNDGIASNGERILPKGWVAESTAPTAPNFAFSAWPEHPEYDFHGYGYLWWVPKPGRYMAVGVYGQWIYVEPSTSLVAVMIGASPRGCYMDPDEPIAQIPGGEHGSPARFEFIDAVRDLLSDQQPG